jgi:putative transposase
MSNISKEVLRKYVQEQKFKNSTEVLNAMKEMFKDVLQEALEAEMDLQLGYDKYNISEKQVQNSRDGQAPSSLCRLR